MSFSILAVTHVSAGLDIGCAVVGIALLIVVRGKGPGLLIAAFGAICLMSALVADLERNAGVAQEGIILGGAMVVFGLWQHWRTSAR